ncbi:hypothetical protein AB751O23_AR_00060 [Chlamydiales bacterium SCGC AB-751-O23]|jgi:hypothetical protein|nr:hypothetical protein AB751O23_AR_00060 [Chlamydiales bacterium SCGC AB-751-O23]
MSDPSYRSPSSNTRKTSTSNDFNSPDSVVKAENSAHSTPEGSTNPMHTLWNGRKVKAEERKEIDVPLMVLCDGKSTSLIEKGGDKGGSVLGERDYEENEGSNLDSYDGSFTTPFDSRSTKYRREEGVRRYSSSTGDQEVISNVPGLLWGSSGGVSKGAPIDLSKMNFSGKESTSGVAFPDWGNGEDTSLVEKRGGTPSFEGLDISRDLKEQLNAGYNLSYALSVVLEEIGETKRAAITSLDLSNLGLSTLEQDLFGVFSKCENLTELNLSGNEINDALLIFLAEKGKQLTKLNLSGCEGSISGDFLGGFDVLESIGLEALYVENLLFLKEAHLIQICRLKTLRTLDLSRDKSLMGDSEDAFEDFCYQLKALEALTSLMLVDWGLTEEEKEDISEELPNLTCKIFADSTFYNGGTH